MAPKNKGGRPPKITENADEFNNSTVAKLKEAFLDNNTFDDACDYAEIDPSNLYRYIKKHPEFRKKIDGWRGNTKRLAKRNIRKKLEEGDIELSKWTLERLDDDYKNKQKQEISGNITGINPITINVIPVKSKNEL